MALSWTDAAGNVWPCKITLGISDEVREATKLDLLHAADNKLALVREILGDVPVLVNVLYTIAKAHKAPGPNDPFPDPKAFRAHIDGDTIEAMADAFLEAVADFSPARLRQTIQAGHQKTREMQPRQLERIKRAIDRLAQQAESQEEQALASFDSRVAAISSGSKPES